MISISIDSRVVAGKKFILKHWAAVETLSAAAVAEVRRRGYKNLAVVATTNDAMLALKEKFDAALGPQIVFSESFLPDVTDFTALAARIRSLTAEAVYLLLYPPQTSILAKQLRVLGYTGAFFGAHPLENVAEVRAAEGALDEAWFVTGSVLADQDFPQRYLKAFNTEMMNGALSGYDVAKMLILGATAPDLNIFLHQLRDFEGVIGKYSATADNGFDLPVRVSTVKELLNTQSSVALHK